jgi:hypothetical protein
MGIIIEHSEGKRPLRRQSRNSVNNIKTDFVEIGLGNVGWIGLGQGRHRWRVLVNPVMNLWVP